MLGHKHYHVKIIGFAVMESIGCYLQIILVDIILFELERQNQALLKQVPLETTLKDYN